MPSFKVIKDIRDESGAAKPPCIAAILCHADDLEFNAGATFAKYLERGWRGVYGVLSLCNSGYAPENSSETVYRPSRDVVPRRTAEAKAAAKFYGAELFQLDLMENVYTDSKGQVVLLDYQRKGVKREEPPRGGLPLATAAGAGLASGPEWSTGPIEPVAEVLIRCKPKLVIGQRVDCNNPDHFAAAMVLHKAYRVAAKRAKLGPLYIGMGRHDFFPGGPDLIVDVTGYEDKAEKALACHVSQGGHTRRCAKMLRERWREWGRKIGVRSAEPFKRIL